MGIEYQITDHTEPDFNQGAMEIAHDIIYETIKDEIREGVRNPKTLEIYKKQ